MEAEYAQLRAKIDRLREQNTRALRLYREKNRTKVNAIAKKYYDLHKDNPEFLAVKRESQRLTRMRKRAELVKEKNTSDLQ